MRELHRLATEKKGLITAYKTKDDQDRALASAFRNLLKDLPPGGSIRAIRCCRSVKTDRFRIYVATESLVREEWSSSMTIIRDRLVNDNNIIAAFPNIEKRKGKKAAGPSGSKAIRKTQSLK